VGGMVLPYTSEAARGAARGLLDPIGCGEPAANWLYTATVTIFVGSSDRLLVAPMRSSNKRASYMVGMYIARA